MKSRLLISLAAGTLVSVFGISGMPEKEVQKSEFPAAHHRYKEEAGTGFTDLRIVFADRYRNPNWEVLYGMIEDEGAQVFFADHENIDPENYDALILGGGYDIDPAFYGEANHGSQDIDKEEDLLQFRAAETFIEKRKPVLGICRGAQLLNVYFGGTLNQDMKGHKGSERTVRVDPGSLFSEVTGKSETVVCWHHQSVKYPGDELIVTMTDENDLGIEGFEHAYLPVYGIQWHPEASSCGREIIRTFLKEVKSRKAEISR